jgi:hypothetical protein
MITSGSVSGPNVNDEGHSSYFHICFSIGKTVKTSLGNLGVTPAGFHFNEQKETDTGRRDYAFGEWA